MKTFTLFAAMILSIVTASARNADSTGQLNDKEKTAKVSTVKAPAFVWGNAAEKVAIKTLTPEFSYGDANETVVIKALAPEFNWGDAGEQVKISFAAPAFNWGSADEKVLITVKAPEFNFGDVNTDTKSLAKIALR
jgi:hypothetical protein